LLTSELNKNLGYNVPRSFDVSSCDELAHACLSLGYPDSPVVVKPPVSNGMRGLRILDQHSMSLEHYLYSKPDSSRCTLESLLAILTDIEEFPRLMVSEYIDGIEYSVDCLISSFGDIAIPRQRNQIRSGISYVTTVTNNASLSNAALHFGRECGLSGVFGLQYIVRDDVPYIIECNPRVQGTMISALATGNNIIWNSLCDRLNLGDERRIAFSYNWREITLRRYWGAYAFGQNTNELF